MPFNQSKMLEMPFNQSKKKNHTTDITLKEHSTVFSIQLKQQQKFHCFYQSIN